VVSHLWLWRLNRGSGLPATHLCPSLSVKRKSRGPSHRVSPLQPRIRRDASVKGVRWLGICDVAQASLDSGVSLECIYGF
jgi:hypothetical protein